jgi:hypothetical protein
MHTEGIDEIDRLLHRVEQGTHRMIPNTSHHPLFISHHKHLILWLNDKIQYRRSWRRSKIRSKEGLYFYGIGGELIGVTRGRWDGSAIQKSRMKPLRGKSRPVAPEGHCSSTDVII